MKYNFPLDHVMKTQQQNNAVNTIENNFFFDSQLDQQEKQFQFNDLFVNKNFTDQEDNPFEIFSDKDSVEFNQSFEFNAEENQQKVYNDHEQENIQQTDQVNTKQKQQQKIHTENSEEMSCKCQSSNCLRLHCSCFKVLGYCSDQCKCLDCLNKKEFKQARQFVIQKTKKIYKKAFEDKCYLVRGIRINKQGCNCRRNCQSQYCGCKKINGQCSPICRCVSCFNNKVSLTKDEIQNFYKPCSRKKDKIIINFKKNLKTKNVSINKNIIYQTYQKNKV